MNFLAWPSGSMRSSINLSLSTPLSRCFISFCPFHSSCSEPVWNGATVVTSPSGKMLECQSITQTYGTNPVLSDVSLTVQPGEIHQISGPSGGGKTTLLRILCLLESPAAGAVLLDGKH